MKIKTIINSKTDIFNINSGNYKYILIRKGGEPMLVLYETQTIHVMAVHEFMKKENLTEIEISGGGKFFIEFDDEKMEFSIIINGSSVSLDGFSYKKDMQKIVYALAGTTDHYVHKLINENDVYPDENYKKYSLKEIEEIAQKFS